MSLHFYVTVFIDMFRWSCVFRANAQESSMTLTTLTTNYHNVCLWISDVSKQYIFFGNRIEIFKTNSGILALVEIVLGKIIYLKNTCSI